MTSDPYRSAYQKAIEDLTSISSEFEQLSARKKHVENLVLALQPMFAAPLLDEPKSSSVAVTVSPHSSQDVVTEPQPTDEPEHHFSFLDVPAPLPASDGYPFERRVKANFRFRGLAAQRSF